MFYEKKICEGLHAFVIDFDATLPADIEHEAIPAAASTPAKAGMSFYEKAKGGDATKIPTGEEVYTTMKTSLEGEAALTAKDEIRRPELLILCVHGADEEQSTVHMFKKDAGVLKE